MNTDLNNIDLKIIELLQQDSRMSHKEIGEKVHRTGQAVGSRIAQLIDLGVIKKYTIVVDYTAKQFIRLYMNEPQSFKQVENLTQQYSQKIECYKVIGDACYMLVSYFNADELNQFLELISEWCRYSVEMVIREIE